MLGELPTLTPTPTPTPTPTLTLTLTLPLTLTLTLTLPPDQTAGEKLEELQKRWQGMTLDESTTMVQRMRQQLEEVAHSPEPEPEHEPEPEPYPNPNPT